MEFRDHCAPGDNLVPLTKVESLILYRSCILELYFDNLDLIATIVVGDGEAETGPLATSWQSNKVPEPSYRRCCTSNSSFKWI